MTTILDFDLERIDGTPLDKALLQNRVILIVNTASRCSLTPQFAALQKLWEHYEAQGLLILGFPCNQFGNQEPDTEDQIAAFCSQHYGVTFPMMRKVDVNGDGAHPLFVWLKNEARGLLGTRSVKWNFGKFLLGRDGRVLRRYAPNHPPEALAADIEAALSA